MKQDILSWYKENLARKWYTLTPLQEDLLNSHVETDLPRRVGKTTCVIIRALYEALTKPYRNILIIVDYNPDYIYTELKSLLFLIDIDLVNLLLKYKIHFNNGSILQVMRNSSDLQYQLCGQRADILITDEVIELKLSPGSFFSLITHFNVDSIYRLATDR